MIGSRRAERGLRRPVRESGAGARAMTEAVAALGSPTRASARGRKPGLLTGAELSKNEAARGLTFRLGGDGRESMAAQSAKVFGRGGDGGKQDVAHHVAPRPSALLGAAQSHAAPEREQGVGDAAQHDHDEGRSRVLLDPWVVAPRQGLTPPGTSKGRPRVVFCEGRVEDLMGGFDSPVATHDEQPLRIRQPRTGQDRNDPWKSQECRSGTK